MPAASSAPPGAPLGAPPAYGGRDGDGWVRITEDRAAVRDHPAVRAWGTLRPDAAAAVAAVDSLPRKRSTLAAIYRLPGVAGPRQAVIAKYWEAAAITVEQRIYQEILPAASVPALHCHGMVSEPDGEHAWLFLEEGCGDRCSLAAPEHQALASQWLARMHTATNELCRSSSAPSLPGLPERGPARFLWHLQSVRDAIQGTLGCRTLDRTQRSLLDHVLGHCDRIEAGWRTFERACERMPRNLVHGDYVAKNLRVARHGGGVALVVMDWEMAGWGPPAPDLHRVDLEAYRATAAEHWRELTMAQVQEWARVGTVFRLLAETHWETQRLFWGGPVPALHRLEGYELALRNAAPA